MRVTVCQLSDDPRALDGDWAALCAHTHEARSDLVLLPEMPFARWFATSRRFDPTVWNDAVRAHERWATRIPELGAPSVVCTRPANDGDRRLNEAFLVAGSMVTSVHAKRYLPDEEGYWEASWYHRGDGAFEPFAADGAIVGMQICTELWTFAVSREYALRGVDIIAVPRATPVSSRDRWIVGGRAAAIISGAYCISSNRGGTSTAGDAFGGTAWIIGPNGEVLALTSDDEPFATRDIDLTRAADAKRTYPRYVR